MGIAATTAATQAHARQTTSLPRLMTRLSRQTLKCCAPSMALAHRVLCAWVRAAGRDAVTRNAVRNLWVRTFAHSAIGRRMAYTPYQLRNRSLVNGLKAKPCADCGIQYASHVMQFDHVSGEKICNISQWREISFEILKNEIEKCEIVCANCHSARTYFRALKKAFLEKASCGKCPLGAFL